MVYICLADGFEEIEGVTPIDLLRRAGIEVTTLGVTGEEVTGNHGITVKADKLIQDADPEKMDMLVLPGGNPGYINLENSQYVQEFLEIAVEKDLPIGAICAAPSILGRAGILKGLKATVYPGMEDQLEGTMVVKQEVVTDGNITTSRGAGTAIPFAARLISILKDQKAAQEVLDSIVYQQ